MGCVAVWKSGDYRSCRRDETSRGLVPLPGGKWDHRAQSEAPRVSPMDWHDKIDAATSITHIDIERRTLAGCGAKGLVRRRPSLAPDNLSVWPSRANGCWRLLEGNAA